MITKPNIVPRKIPPTKIAMTMTVTPSFLNFIGTMSAGDPEPHTGLTPAPSIYPKLYMNINLAIINPPKCLISDR
jgi:hypothetical protein